MLQTTRIVPLLLFVSVITAGCNQSDLGRYCFVGAQTTNSNAEGSITILNTEAPECGERLCLKQGGYKCTAGAENCAGNTAEQEKVQAMCTSECSENKDCEKSDENVNGCKSYVCQEQGAETGFGDHCICVCRDFIRTDTGASITAEQFNENPEYKACK